MGIFIGFLIFCVVGFSALAVIIKAIGRNISGSPKVDSIPDSAQKLPLIHPYAVLFVDGPLLILRDKKGRDKTIPISSIQSVKLNPPTKFVRGTLILSIPKSPTGALGLGGGTTVLVGNEDETYVFLKEEFDSAQKIHAHIQSVMSSRWQPVPVSFNITDELTKLKTLFDDGVLNREEFEAAKKKLFE